MRTAVYMGTKNLYEDMVTAAKSLLINSNVEKIYFLIEDDKFPYIVPSCIECINVKNQMYFSSLSPNANSRWTYMVLMKTVLHRMFPELEKILVLDVDTIVDKDISDLWDIDISNYYLAGASEPNKSKDSIYINTGVMMLNLHKLRDGKGDKIIKDLNTVWYEFPEQDCINKLCKGGIMEIPSDYNANNYTSPTKNPKIHHFAATKNWQSNPLVKKYQAINYQSN